MKKILLTLSILVILLVSLTLISSNNSAVAIAPACTGTNQENGCTCATSNQCNSNNCVSNMCQAAVLTPTPILTLTLTLTPTPTIGENQVLCHRIQQDVCEEQVLGSCNGTEWFDGGCITPTPTSGPTPTNTPGGGTGGTGGPGDGLSDGKSDGRSDGRGGTSGQVLGTSTGQIKAVLGLSTTSGEGNMYFGLIQLISAMGLAATGFKFFKRNA